MKRTLAILLAAMLGMGTLGISMISASAAPAAELTFNAVRHGFSIDAVCWTDAPRISAPIRNMRELQARMRNYRGEAIWWNVNGQLTFFNDHVFGHYDATFFENNFLLIVQLDDNISTVHAVDAVRSDGRVEITRNMDEANDMNKDYYILIEVCNSYIPSQFYLFLDGVHVATSQTPAAFPWLNVLGAVAVIVLAIISGFAVFFFVRTLFFV
ncbi:MAG: hypothetical protein FWE40_02910 [Oscillospiraceae bacterium]|nr:hypothetical protein [Oscillospiraceae bacterium]